MTAELVILGGTLVEPSGSRRCDLVIDHGRVVDQAEPGTGEAREVVDADGLMVLPGAVDPHVHMMDPGLTEREDLPTGTAAAAVGA